METQMSNTGFLLLEILLRQVVGANYQQPTMFLKKASYKKLQNVRGIVIFTTSTFCLLQLFVASTSDKIMICVP